MELCVLVPMIYFHFSQSTNGQFNLAIISYGIISKMPLFRMLISIELAFCCQISICYAFLYRFCVMSDKSDWLSKKGTIALMAILQFVCGLPAVWVNYNAMSSRCTPTECCPGCTCLSCTLSNTSAFQVGNGPSAHFAVPLELLSIFLIILAQFVRMVITNRALQRLRNLFNCPAESYVYQRQLFVSLMLQFFVPFIINGLTFCAIIAAQSLRLKSTTAIFRFSFAIGSTHTVFNGLVMLTIVKPYREAILSKLAIGTANRIEPLANTIQ